MRESVSQNYPISVPVSKLTGPKTTDMHQTKKREENEERTLDRESCCEWDNEA